MTRALPLGTAGLSRELLKRLPLCAAAVLICYQLQWTWLRFLTSEATLRFVGWCGYTGERLSPNLIAWHGQQFQFDVACTYADVFCGALPFLWLRGTSLVRNAASVAAFAAGLFAFNLLHQAATDLAFIAGVPWTLADETIGGLSYFAVWVFLVRRLERSPATTLPTAATPAAVVP